MLSFVLVMVLTKAGYAKEWKGITPYHTTKSEVEKIMKDYQAEVINDCWTMYDNEEEKVHIEYTCYPCSKGKIGTTNLPKDTVSTIQIYYKKMLTLTQLGIKVEKFSRYTARHIGGYILEDDKAGYELHVNEEKVYVSFYRAPRKEINKKRCK